MQGLSDTLGKGETLPLALVQCFVVEMVLASSFLNFPAIRPCEWVPVVSDNRDVPAPPGCREQK